MESIEGFEKNAFNGTNEIDVRLTSKLFLPGAGIAVYIPSPVHHLFF